MTDIGRELPSGELTPQGEIARMTRQTGQDFTQNVARPVITDCDSRRAEISASLNKWIVGRYPGLKNLINTYLDKKNGVLTAEQKTMIGTLMDDAAHDLMVVIAPLQLAFLGSPEHQSLLTAPIVDLPRKVLERFARQVEGKRIIEDVNPRDICQNVYDFFKTYLSNVEEAEISLDIQGERFSLVRGDPLDLEAALFNLVRNSQKRLASGKGKNIAINLKKLEDGGARIEVADDAGGFDTGGFDDSGKPVANLLDEVQIINSRGAKVTTQLAFVRGESRGEEKGSGLGLDIARRIIEDDFGGKVVAWNAKFKETGDQGALITIDLPAGNK